jgi:RimJ/RimL family protein N-acetyltransferase
MNILTIQKLLPEDSVTWSQLLTRQSPSYRKDFFPFPDESEQALISVLEKCLKDCYWGMWNQKKLIGFFMLRGWDLGFCKPSFGVLIDERQRHKGLATLALQTAISYCRLEEVSELILKVDSRNESALNIYKGFGFEKTGLCPKLGHIMMNLKLED